MMVNDSQYWQMLAEQEQDLTQTERDFWKGDVISPTEGVGLLHNMTTNDSAGNPYGTNLSNATQTSPSAQVLIADNIDRLREEDNQPPPGENKHDPETKGFFDTLKEGIFGALGDKDQVGKIFGTAIASSAQGVMAWLKSRQDAKAQEQKIAHEKQLIDEKVSRASAVPTMQRMTKTTPGKRAAGTLAIPTPSWNKE